MERTKGANAQTGNEGKSRWKKIGGGSFRLPGKIIKPNEIFYAYPNEIPKGFRDVVIPLDKDIKWDEPTKPDVVIVPPVVNVPSFSAKKRDGSQWYDIFDAQGKKLNEKGLTKEKAEAFIEDLLKK